MNRGKQTHEQFVSGRIERLCKDRTKVKLAIQSVEKERDGLPDRISSYESAIVEMRKRQHVIPVELAALQSRSVSIDEAINGLKADLDKRSSLAAVRRKIRSLKQQLKELEEQEDV